MPSENDVHDCAQPIGVKAVIALKPLWVLLGFLACSFAAAEDPEASIHRVLDGLHESAAASEIDRYFAHYTEDAVFLGTDASERWTVDQFRDYAEPAFSSGRGWVYRVRSRNLIQTNSPDIFAFDEVLFNEKLGLCRGSGLIVREAGQWRISQYVLSMLIPNELAGEVGQQSIDYSD
jgi:hypothetical protein